MFDKYSKLPSEVFQRQVGLSLGTFMHFLDKSRVAFFEYENEQPNRTLRKKELHTIIRRPITLMLALYDGLLNFFNFMPSNC
jgi:hypothetical protein